MIDRPVAQEPDACQEARRIRLERIEAIIQKHLGCPIAEADCQRFMATGTFQPGAVADSVGKDHIPIDRRAKERKRKHA